MSQRYVILPQVRAPHMGLSTVDAVAGFVDKYKPQLVVQTGGISDDSNGACSQGVRRLLFAVRQAAEVVVQAAAAGHPSLRWWHGLEAEFGDLELVNGWVVTSTKGRSNVGGPAGNTALYLARRAHKSLIVGDTGQLGIGQHTVASKRLQRTITGVEAGALGRQSRRLSYSGFATVAVQEGRTIACCYRIESGRVHKVGETSSSRQSGQLAV